MLCDNCKKNEATVHIKKIHNGKCISHNLCAICAHETENNGGLEGLGFNLADVLFKVNKLSEKITQQPALQPDNLDSLICPNCAWTLQKLQKNNGRLGCPECYNTFSTIVNNALPKVHRGVIHLGKHPKIGTKATLEHKTAELNKLQKELSELVKREEYEAAALCRDRIIALKKELENSEL